jgi:hypothetical protein
MELKIDDIHKLNDLVAYYQTYNCSKYIPFFRGESQIRPIRCGLARTFKTSRELIEIEKNVYNDFIISISFKKYLRDDSYDRNFKYFSKWINIFQSQHLGLKTRLIDWTQCFNTALNFVVTNEKKINQEGVLWVYKCPDNEDYLINFNDYENYLYYNSDPYKLKQTMLIKHYTLIDNNYSILLGEKLRFRQDGSFVLLSNNDLIIPFEDHKKFKIFIDKLIISPKLKLEIREKIMTDDFNYFVKVDNIHSKEFEELESESFKINRKYGLV